jgi:uncharacterized membrane protein
METQTKEIALSKLVILATIAGMRSMLAPALLALNLNQKDKKLFNQEGIGFLANPTTTKTLAIMATAELGLDKLPFTFTLVKTTVYRSGFNGCYRWSINLSAIW